MEHRPEHLSDGLRAYRGPRRHLGALAASIGAHAALLAAIIYLIPPLAHRPTSIVLAYLIEVGSGGSGDKARGAGPALARSAASGDAADSVASLAPAVPPTRPRRHRAGGARDDSHDRDDAADVAALRPTLSSASLGLPLSAGPAAQRGGSGGGAGSESAPHAPGAGAGGARIGGAVASGVTPAYARYGDSPLPPYPARSRRHGEQGTVTLHVLVAADGAVERVELAASSGFDALDRAALDTIRSRWRFVAARRDGVAVESWVLVPIRFTLTEASAR